MNGAQRSEPAWAAEMRGTLASGIKKGYEEPDELYVEPREEIELRHVKAVVVFRENGDVVFQFFPKDKRWPGPDSARSFLAEAIQGHFGSTENFAATYTPELDSWAAISRGLTGRVGYSKKFHVDRFLVLIDDALNLMVD